MRETHVVLIPSQQVLDTDAVLKAFRQMISESLKFQETQSFESVATGRESHEDNTINEYAADSA